MRKILLTLLLGFGLISTAAGQNTCGLISYNYPLSQDGYNLFYPFDQPTVYLTDMCGRIVNTWTDTSFIRPGNGVHLMENGQLLVCRRDVSIAGDPIWAGGGGEYVQIRDWYNTLVWSMELEDSLRRLHHDVIPMPGGNIMLLAWEKKTRAEAVAAGRDTSLLAGNQLWPDFLMEIQPIGRDSFAVVWEWHAWDHLIQDYDSAQGNYGVVGDHPELIDINLDGAMPVPADWMHVNAIDYNETTDQIMLCVPAFNEIWIIDHSTTTAEAASHTGGLSGIGGDLMFRWGNPANYRASGPQQLFFQHNAHWMDIELPAGHSDRTKILLFNNQKDATYSAVNVIAPVFDTYEWEYMKDTTTGTFYPSGFAWEFTTVPQTDLHSTQLSSAQRLPNGNTLIASGNQGYALEVTPAKDIVWEYILPFNSGVPMMQGDSVLPGTNRLFHMKRYTPAYPGFTGLTLIGREYIESKPDTAFCPSLISNIQTETESNFRFYPNPAQDRLMIEMIGASASNAQLIDAHGRIVRSVALAGLTTEVSVADLPNGLYMVIVDQRHAGKLIINR